MSFLDVRQRVREPEVMDDPALEEDLHFDALHGLERINRISFTGWRIWSVLKDLLPRVEGPLHVLDVATGAGDLPLYLWHKATRAGWPVRLEACDRSPKALEYARRRTAQVGAAIRFFEWDVLAGPFPECYDVVTCSLFLHHLEEDQAIRLLHHMAQAARDMVVVSDLNRSAAGLLLCYAGTWLLTASTVVHTDGPLSVRAAFTPAEARHLAQRAGLEGASVRRTWPFRWLLRWQRHLADTPIPGEEAAWSRPSLGEATL